MKTNLLNASISAMMLFAVLGFTTLQPGNGKRNKENKEHGEKGNRGNEDKNVSRGNENGHQSNERANQPGDKQENSNRGKSDEKADRSGGKSEGKGNTNKIEHAQNGKKNGNGHKEDIRWGFDNDIDWNLANFGSRKHPKDQKKVTICHQTGNSVPVNINVSENALQAHMKHGDQLGNCNIDFGSWPKNYVTSRENVYNSYENTWETMSYSEALLKIALEKLLGIKTDLNQNRSRLSAQEIQRREMLIMELQNNTNSLDGQIGVTRQTLNGININIQL